MIWINVSIRCMLLTVYTSTVARLRSRLESGLVDAQLLSRNVVLKHSKQCICRHASPTVSLHAEQESLPCLVAKANTIKMPDKNTARRSNIKEELQVKRRRRKKSEERKKFNHMPHDIRPFDPYNAALKDASRELFCGEETVSIQD